MDVGEIYGQEYTEPEECKVLSVEDVIDIYLDKGTGE